MKPTDVQPPANGTARAFLGLLSRTGPEAPPDLAAAPPPAYVAAPPPAHGAASPPAHVAASPPAHVAEEPTTQLPTIAPRRVPPPPPRVAARAVIVYEPQPRRSWGLWVFTGLLVALTIGVVLGQTAAFRPVSRAASAAQTEPLPAYVPPPPPPPAAVTEPLGAARTATVEVGGTAALLQVRGADLGPVLFRATAPAGPIPALERTRRGPRLTVTGHTELLLNTAVTWKLRLTGTFGAQQIDLRGARTAAVELTGDSPDAALFLPRPSGTVPLRITGTLKNLRIEAGAPVRVRLGKGADTANIDGTQRRTVRSGATLAGKYWRPAERRYDVTVTKRVGALVVARTP